MIVVASANAAVGMSAAWDVLQGGGSAIDAVEAATRLVESNPDDHTVGYGGYPNLVGDVELDASIMDGAARRAGAVGSLRGYRHAISVARAVMERLPHVLVVGEGAARLAAELGMAREELLTKEAERVWRDGLAGKLGPDSLAGRMLSQVAALATDPDHAAGTVNVIARDAAGHLASAVSTSGWAWKYPGRLGDSPVIGAGNYADDRHGAAACTGFGELAIRARTAGSIVGAVAAGVGLDEACAAAVRDLGTLGVPAGDVIMHLVAIDRDEHHAGVTTQRRAAEYLVQRDGMTEPDLLPRTVIDPTG
jgi:beta-aspartyl-peptidase (threonine type)